MCRAGRSCVRTWTRGASRAASSAASAMTRSTISRSWSSGVSSYFCQPSKKARRRGAVIVFVDETGFSYQVEARTTWGPEGHTPVLRTVSKRRQVSTAIGLTASGRIYREHFDHAIHGEDMVVLLEHLRRRVGGPMILIWDRLQVHR